MKRTIESDLDAWAAHPARKPLILRGARQVGKSWLVRDWGIRRWGRVVEVNFERRPDLRPAFVEPDPRATLRRLEAVLGQAIPTDGTALLFLDEVQSAPPALAALRWFAEEIPALPVVAAGSLLDVALAAPVLSMPVGRVTYLHLEPMGFLEFAEALAEDPLVAWIRGDVTPSSIGAGTALPLPVHARAMALFRDWILVGGMPAAVEAWRLRRSPAEIASLHRDLLASLRDDFGKYAGRVPHGRLATVLEAVPRQLGGKFRFVDADRGERTAALAAALDLLIRARVCHRVPATAARGVPLGAEVRPRVFKCLFLDVGMASTSLGLDLRAVEGSAELTLVHRGAVAEQAVGQLLRLTAAPHAEPALFWWRRDRRGSEAEVDFVTSRGPRVVPVEVKAGASGTLRSLHGFMAERGFPLAVRIHSAPPEVREVEGPAPPSGRARYRLLSLPPYLVEELPRLLDGPG